MTTLKEEEPFAYVVTDEYLNNTCSFCLAHEVTVHKCKGCHVLSYCGDKCQKNDWINHKNECQILKKFSTLPRHLLPPAHNRLTMRILLKSTAALSQKAFNGRTWNSLVDPVMGGNPSNFDSIVDRMVCELKPFKGVDRASVAKAFGRTINNAVSIFDNTNGMDEVGMGVYLGLSIHKHSCIPNSQLIFTGTKASLRSIDETAKYSTDLTISYTNLAPWNPDHKSFIRQVFNVDCTCALCSDDNHIMNRMGSSCYVNCCEDAAGILDENCSGPYRCNKCGKPSSITVNDVILAQDKIKDHLEMVNSLDCNVNLQINPMITLLLSSEKVLSVYNFHIIKLCQFVQSKMAHNAREMHIFLTEKELKAAEYYLHAMDRRSVMFLMLRTTLKFGFGSTDDFDESQALNALDRTFGKDHPITVESKKLVERFLLNRAMEHICISTIFSVNRI